MAHFLLVVTKKILFTERIFHIKIDKDQKRLKTESSIKNEHGKKYWGNFSKFVIMSNHQSISMK